MIPETPRLLSPTERALIGRLLEHADRAHAPYLALDQLRVTAHCECGCGSIRLVPSTAIAPTTERSHVLADAYGTVQGGHAVGLLLWGTDRQVTGLEIYSLAFDPPFELPAPDSVSDIPADDRPAI
jgi:hypothetical protein